MLVKYRGELVQFVSNIHRTGQVRLSPNLIIVILIVLLALINRAIHPFQTATISNLFPFILLLPLTYLIAIKLNRTDLKVLIILIFIEGIVVMAEYAAGVSTFFTGLGNYMEFDTGELLYFKRPLGLSENSSNIAGKLILGLILIDFVNWKNTWSRVMQLVMIVALFLTFNRTAFVVLAAYFAMRYLPGFLSMRWKIYKVVFVSTLGMVMFGLAVYWFALNFEEVYVQLTRNQGKIELAGRELIWVEFASFIKENWFFGNGSYKLMLPYHQKLAHSHNSFLQVLATHGLIITMAYLYLIVRNLTKRNLVFVVAICLYSMAQYGIFWGISLMDIIFFMFLISPSFATQETTISVSPNTRTQTQMKPSG